MSGPDHSIPYYFLSLVCECFVLEGKSLASCTCQVSSTLYRRQNFTNKAVRLHFGYLRTNLFFYGSFSCEEF